MDWTIPTSRRQKKSTCIIRSFIDDDLFEAQEECRDGRVDWRRPSVKMPCNMSSLLVMLQRRDMSQSVCVYETGFALVGCVQFVMLFSISAITPSLQYVSNKELTASQNKRYLQIIRSTSCANYRHPLIADKELEKPHRGSYRHPITIANCFSGQQEVKDRDAVRQIEFIVMHLHWQQLCCD